MLDQPSIMVNKKSIKEEHFMQEQGDKTLLNGTVVAVKDVLGCDLHDEVIILNMVSGVYYGLDSLGARIWELIQEPILVRDVCEVILDEYDVEREQCENDLCIFLEELTANNLAEVKN